MALKKENLNTSQFAYRCVVFGKCEMCGEFQAIDF